MPSNAIQPSLRFRICRKARPRKRRTLLFCCAVIIECGVSAIAWAALALELDAILKTVTGTVKCLVLRHYIPRYGLANRRQMSMHAMDARHRASILLVGWEPSRTRCQSLLTATWLRALRLCIVPLCLTTVSPTALPLLGILYLLVADTSVSHVAERAVLSSERPWYAFEAPGEHLCIMGNRYGKWQWPTRGISQAVSQCLSLVDDRFQGSALCPP
ncbi:uncharacterized protein B0H18DRAFT_207375 [Fomitopsis serialis]|uniref:uncharacterized protein n=1 Tax=Fomitopsis serialis TaxID=139415 RepID=UPI0020081102|nr:uncharacterized protein B0H18DRAFT_207375 [Neoantrodia serialis]KAH9929335.1 hypothetical protein B0H18DRAFT_207375 [Neoantrodia serialis]